MRCTPRAVNPWKAAGPDGICGRLLKDCVDQLVGVFTKIFNQSFSQFTVPSCLKSPTIVPLPKRSNFTTLNDYRQVALKLMKCFEKLGQSHIMSFIPPTFDPHQFAHRAKRSTEESVATALHAALSHLEQQGSCARLIFIDFSTSTALSLSPCSPLGCVLIPLLYTLCTHDCTPTHHSNTVIKFADDTTVVGLISRGEETA